METLCCSDICERRSECGRHYTNNEGTYYVESFDTFGWGSISSNGRCETHNLCGKSGNWDMFAPIRLTEKEFVKLHCSKCGSQRCEGIGTEWFDGCRFKEHLNNKNLI